MVNLILSPKLISQTTMYHDRVRVSGDVTRKIKLYATWANGEQRLLPMVSDRASSGFDFFQDSK